MFALVQIDDFDAEVEALYINQDFMGLLQQLSNEEINSSIEDLRKELSLEKE